MKKLCIITVLFASAFHAHAQQKAIDSLKRLISTANEDTRKGNAVL